MTERILHLLWSGDIGGIEKLCFNLGKFKGEKHSFLFVHAGGQIYDAMKKEHICTNILEMKNTDLLRFFHYLQAECKKEKFKAVIIHHDSPMLWLAGIYLKKCLPAMRLYVYAHCNFNDFVGKNRKKCILFKCVSRVSDAIIAISNNVKESIIKNIELSDKKIAVIYNGVQTEQFQIRSIHSQQKSEEINLIYIGRLIPQKGVQNIIKATSMISENVCLRIVGDGGYREKLEAICSELKCKVMFLGNRSDIPELLSESDIFIHMPDWEEGFGITVIEAMASGKVCITANSGAMPEIITDGVNGFLVEKGNIKSLADKIEYVIKNIESNEIKVIQNNAILRARNFSIENYSDQLDRLIANS